MLSDCVPEGIPYLVRQVTRKLYPLGLPLRHVLFPRGRVDTDYLITLPPAKLRQLAHWGLTRDCLFKEPAILAALAGHCRPGDLVGIMREHPWGLTCHNIVKILGGYPGAEPHVVECYEYANARAYPWSVPK
jgi:hypothetical protein